eukprot:2654560-Prymnesium_polylepis.1
MPPPPSSRAMLSDASSPSGVSAARLPAVAPRNLLPCPICHVLRRVQHEDHLKRTAAQHTLLCTFRSVRLLYVKHVSLEKPRSALCSCVGVYCSETACGSPPHGTRHGACISARNEKSTFCNTQVRSTNAQNQARTRLRLR